MTPSEHLAHEISELALMAHHLSDDVARIVLTSGIVQTLRKVMTRAAEAKSFTETGQLSINWKHVADLVDVALVHVRGRKRAR